MESYIKRLKELEELALGFEGVNKCYAIQAGREIRVIVKSDKVSDEESVLLSRDIAKKIEEIMKKEHVDAPPQVDMTHEQAAKLYIPVRK